MAEHPTVGQACSLASCKDLDFLPFTCSHCQGVFCRVHALPASLHACPADPSTTIVVGHKFADKFNDLLPDPNRRVTDRDDAAKERDSKRDAARAVLEKNFGKAKVAKLGGAKDASAPAAPKPKHANPIIELMRLKQRAGQGDPRKSAGDVPMDQRMYWTTYFFECESGERVEKGKKELWMPKSTSAGKALDLLADHFKLQNVNNLGPDPAKSGTWSRANMQRAVEAMHRDGLVVFSGIVDPDALEKLRVVMTAESNEIQKLKTNPTQYNHGLMTNFLQAPPLANPALLFPAVYQNPFVVQVAEAYLGPGLCMPFITANTAIKRTTEKQPIHKDTSFVHPSAPFMAISNFLLSDFKPENGSTGSPIPSLPQSSRVQP
ncbi:hypothetical protein RQP46_004090 [Phenoliferia psychrophenolica]